MTSKRTPDLVPASGAPAPKRLPDADARDAAVDPRLNVVLEASAGTGKTRVLVDRYLNLIRLGVDPANILAITFTRKAAAEMRQRVIDELRRGAALSPEDAARWRALRDRLGEIAVCTIDAFCLLLLREFPLEADLDPDFEVADETEMARLVEESLDGTLRIARSLARTDEDVALLFAQLGEKRLRSGLAALLERRLAAEGTLRRVLTRGPRDLTIAVACSSGSGRLIGALGSGPGGIEAFLEGGPAGHPRFAMLANALRVQAAASAPNPSALRALVDQLSAHVLTKDGKPRKRLPDVFSDDDFATPRARRSHLQLVTTVAPVVRDAILAFRRDLNVIVSRGVWRVFQVAVNRHRRTLENHGVLDFGELLARATALLGQMDEFARSRFLLEARYHHVLVDEFQDTSRAQWDLVSQLVRTWGEGLGLAADAPLRPSIFIVGDRKQSIYGFRDAEVQVLAEAASAIAALRENEDPVRSISHSFRSTPPLLAFANDLFRDVGKEPERSDAFTYGERDAFPIVDESGAGSGHSTDESALGVIAHEQVRQCAAAVAQEIGRLLSGGTVRDRQTGMRRTARPGDVAILFRSRASHREYERALEALRIPSYVYKGLGFFDADEIKDIIALIRYLADPTSDLRAAALLRSRIVRLSDPGLQRLAPALADALSGRREPPAVAELDAEDRSVLSLLRAIVPTWLDLADRVPPAELLDAILADCAYAYELRGAGAAQARENVKKIRALVRRIQNRGYPTLARLAADLDQLGAGDESNATVDALDAVSLMTVHAAKGLEFPVVFVVNLSRGTRGGRDPIRISPGAADEDAVAVGDFQTDFDEDSGDRDKEETKRLLYVAVTRARDRLYITSTTRKGRIYAAARSLATVVPDSFKKMLESAAAPDSDGAETDWEASSGRRHRFRRCLVPAEQVAGAGSAVSPQSQTVAVDSTWTPGSIGKISGDDDFAPIADADPAVRVSVTDVVRTPGQTEWRAPTGDERDALIAGRLVHRLFQFDVDPSDESAALVRANQMLDDEDRDSVADADAVVHRALSVFAKMRTRADVRVVLDRAECFYEVPVSFTAEGLAGQIVRGAIDCVARQPDGEIVVVDFKTGVPRESDQRQVDLYVGAARCLYPDVPVRGVIIYPE